ncbi:MAG: phage tail protein [Anaerolineae bacterium]|nr:phage tail protein [Anaerolineae bacterium]
MAASSERADPFLAFRFVVKIDGENVGGFSECTGLRLETETQDYIEGGLNTHVHKLPTRTKQTNITLKRGIVDKTLWDWYWALVQGSVERKSGSVVVKDTAGEADVMIFEFRRAFPVKWIGPDLNATQNSVAVEQIELAHEWLERMQ